MRPPRATLLAALLAAATALPGLAEEPPRTITVGGEGAVEVAPDIATLTAGVETQADTAAAALEENRHAMVDVFATLQNLGVAPGDMQTSQLSLDPVWTDSGDGSIPPKLTGYRAGNIVTVRLRGTDGIGPAIDAMTAAGANRLLGVSFYLADPKAALDGAREKAIADARARAELYARASGVGLGPVLRIRETEQMPGPIMMRAEAAGTPVAPGSVSLEARVEMVFGLQ